MGQSAIFHRINNIHAPEGTLGQRPIKGLGKYLFPTFARNAFWKIRGMMMDEKGFIICITTVFG